MKRRGLSFNSTLAVIAALSLTLSSILASEEGPLQPVANPLPLLAEVQRKMSAFRSDYLEFTQERILKLFSEPLKSQGVMLIDQPGLLRWETTAPYQSILLGDRKSVAQFEKEEGQWKKLKLGFPQMLRRVIEQMSLMQQGKLDALINDFTISAATNSQAAVLTMVPKDENTRSMMSSLEIHLLPDLSATHEVVMNEPGGDFTRILFSHERRNVTFPARTFDQTKPLELAAVRAALGDAP